MAFLRLLLPSIFYLMRQAREKRYIVEVHLEAQAPDRNSTVSGYLDYEYVLCMRSLPPPYCKHIHTFFSSQSRDAVSDHYIPIRSIFDSVSLESRF